MLRSASRPAAHADSDVSANDRSAQVALFGRRGRCPVEGRLPPVTAVLRAGSWRVGWSGHSRVLMRGVVDTSVRPGETAGRPASMGAGGPVWAAETPGQLAAGRWSGSARRRWRRAAWDRMRAPSRALEAELAAVERVFAGLSGDEWRLPTRLVPVDPDLPHWTVFELAGHFDISIGLTRMLIAGADA